ncbi:hypothetical protein ACN20G_35400 (plasmid) [Streptomyces sp. BI20]|uniref:hypothetical protein n=1 Tax=Streptomyces sp. BI20 TaxID=3403460 RepID=UPI003C7562DF
MSGGEGNGLGVVMSRRMYEYAEAGAVARRRLHVLLAAAGVEAGEADELVSAVEAGAVAGAYVFTEEFRALGPRNAAGVEADPWQEGWEAGVDVALQLAARRADRARQETRGHARHARVETAEPAAERAVEPGGEGGR